MGDSTPIVRVAGGDNTGNNNSSERNTAEEEYNKFRVWTAYWIFFFSSLLMLLRSWVWDGCFPGLPVQIYQAWLLFVYTGLALKENIWGVKGINIRPWWKYRHYCAMLMTLISLTWDIQREPNCYVKQKGIRLFMFWANMQGVAMLLHNRYHGRNGQYTRIALGEDGRMHVIGSETAVVEHQLWLLFPILFVLQAFEAYVGLLLLQTAVLGVISEWQVFACGILVIIMGVGDFTSTVKTLISKSRVS